MKVSEQQRLILANAVEHGTVDVAEVLHIAHGWPISGDRFSTKRINYVDIGGFKVYNSGQASVRRSIKALQQKGLLKTDKSLTQKGADLAETLGLGRDN